MNELLTSGRVVDVALVVLVLELVGLFVWHRRSGRGLNPIDLIGHLLAGACLLLALRAYATGADYRWTLLFLTASFPAHLFDLTRRARGRADA